MVLKRMLILDLVAFPKGRFAVLQNALAPCTEMTPPFILKRDFTVFINKRQTWECSICGALCSASGAIFLPLQCLVCAAPGTVTQAPGCPPGGRAVQMGVQLNSLS